MKGRATWETCRERGIDEVEEGSTEIERQRSENRRIEAGQEESSRPPGRPVDRARSTGQSTDVHDVHRISPVDRGMERSTVRWTDWKQAALGLGPVDRGHGSVDRPVDWQTRFGFPFRIQIPFLFGIESNLGFLKLRDSVAINKG